jgi:hypothetical protein
MALRNRSEIIRTLAEYRSDDILGTPETTTLDFKRCLYPLNKDKGKYDLCSDVAAMANATGGILVCGFIADKAPNEVYEFASKAAPVPRSRLDVGRHKDILLRHVWPRVAVSFEWFDLAENDDANGFLVIEVEPLPEHQRYAMVRQFLNADGKLCEGFTIPVRHGDQTTYPVAEELHRLMTDGHRVRDFAATSAPQDAVSSALTAKELNERIAAMMTTRPPGWAEEPLLFWQSTPEKPTGILDGMYDSDGVYGALADPKPLRPGGFNFAFLRDRPRTEAGALTAGEPRRAVRIDTDGTVTAAALANNEMLGWGMDRATISDGRNRLNVIGLTEMTLEYFRFVDEHVMPRVEGAWRHRVLTCRFQEPPVVKLGGGGNPTWPMIGRVHEASAQEWDRSWAAVGDAERDAYEALKRIYALFGISVKENPFIADDRVNTVALLSAADR